MENMKDRVRIREYRKDDYDQVVRLFVGGISETHNNYVKFFYNGEFPNLIIFEVIFFVSGNFFGYYTIDNSLFCSISSGAIFVLIFCLLSFMVRWRWNKNYIRKVLAYEMNDETLAFCTTYPNAFFIATDVINDDKVLGMIGCEKITDSTFELTRLTVLPDARKLGIGKMLVVKATNYFKSYGCDYIQLTTYKTMFAAVRLYMKLGFQIIEEVN